jgi:transcriptional regulator with XRE-family HTH domain
MKRRRGVVLTPIGLQRLQAAILAVEVAENQGQRFTLEELGDRINVSTKTLSRLWSLNSGVDQKTLKLCFSAFNLELRRDDYLPLGNVMSDDAAGTSTSSVPATLDQSPSLSAHLATISPLAPADATGNLPTDNLPTDNLPIDNLPASDPPDLNKPDLNKPDLTLSYPDGPVPLHSSLYIERPPIEALAYQEVLQPGCVIRIRAPREMGKSSLMLRILTFAETQGYYTVNLDCNQIDSSNLTDLNKFLRSFCLRVAMGLGLEPKLNDYWDEDIGSKLSCSLYFKTYLLEQIQQPLVLVLNEIDRFFEYPQFAQEFFPMLRSWYEEARCDENFQKLRLVVVYSTEEYVALDINRSPFNIGLPLRLPEFTQPQVQALAQRHGLNWSIDNVSRLMGMVGGHPALIRIALYYICTQTMSLDQLLQEAMTNGGIFQYHLWRHWVTLLKNPKLVDALAAIVNPDPRNPDSSISLDPIQAYKLESQGLIRYAGDRIQFRCELYRAYFNHLLSSLRRL